MTDHEKYMLRCLELAKLGLGSTAPNPSVGCVIVHNSQIIGEGFTSPYGGNHAEVNAIRSVENQALLPESTVYVSLEPCAHFGKTPPCANLIIEKKIKRVVVATLDPFAEVNGLGIQKMMKAGIDVSVGTLEKEALEQNRRFITFHEKKRPYIILKWAETANGFVDIKRNDSNQTALKITCEASNMLVHKWRAEEAAIMVAKNTAVLDNPSLTTRKYDGKNPTRILLDADLETPANAQIFSDEAETLVFCNSGKAASQNIGTETIAIEDVQHVESILKELHHRQVQSVIVEGGPTLHRSFYEAGLWDEARRFIAPFTVENGIKALRITEDSEEEIQAGPDRLVIYRNR